MTQLVRKSGSAVAPRAARPPGGESQKVPVLSCWISSSFFRSSPWYHSTTSVWSPKKSVSWKSPLPRRSVSLPSPRRCIWNAWGCCAPSSSSAGAARPWRSPSTRSIFPLDQSCIRHKPHVASSCWTRVTWVQGRSVVPRPGVGAELSEPELA